LTRDLVFFIVHSAALIGHGTQGLGKVGVEGR
jgi:hypothetical protein